MKSELFLEGSLLWTCAWQSTFLAALGLIAAYVFKDRTSRAHQVLVLSIVATLIVPVASMFVKHYKLGILTTELDISLSLNEERKPINDHEPSQAMPGKKDDGL